MPNWCNNDITFTGDDLPKFKEWLSQGKFSFERIKPTPQDLLQGEGWYNWRVNNWGTKWDIDPATYGESIKDTEIGMSFDTAWSPPIEALYELHKQFPLLNIKLNYWEMGLAFAGEALYANGICNDTCYSQDEDAKQYNEMLRTMGYEYDEEEQDYVSIY